MPLPPYIASRREPDEIDRTDYQTLFAREEGSVAAPTAGLHFTQGLVERLRDRGIGLHKLTLHVGAGTFLPVKTDDISGHKMHAEFGTVSPETAAALNAVRAKGGRSLRSVRRPCAFSKAPLVRTVASALFPGKPRSS